jgi:hypothetical protein
MYVRMMYVDPAFAQAGVEGLYADGAEFLNEDAYLNFFINEEGKDNPLYASNVRKLNVATNLRVSATLYRYLEQNTDPRLGNYVSDPTKVLPMPQGGFNINSPSPLNAPNVAVFAQSPVSPVYFISLVESKLLQAEVVARGWTNGTGDDKALYDEAVTIAFNRYSYDATGFLAADGVYEYPAGTFEQKQEAIMMAKWAAFAGSQSIEMFFETTRTHYPKVSTEPSWDAGAYNPAYVGGLLTYSLEGVTSGAFPKRLPYPQDEVNLNAKFPGQAEVTAKVWWDVKP